MNKNAKRLLSMVLCLMLVLSALPLAALAADTMTLYCKAPSAWATCCAYWWDGPAPSAAWPGNAMEVNADGLWCIEIPVGTTKIVFNNNNGSQTADLDVPTDDKNMFTVAEGAWNVYDPTPVVEYDYYVAGSGTLCGSEWNPSDIANGMTDKDGDGVYNKLYENVAAGSYEFKVTDGTWDNCWPGANYALTVEADDSVEIFFDSATGEVTIAIGGIIPEPPVTEPTEPSVTEPFVPGVNEYALVGYINGADYGCNDDYETIGDYIFVDGALTATFNADSYVFIKTTDNANWYMTEAYCAETTGTFVTTGAEKMFVPGNVEITFTLVENEDGTLTLSYVTGAEVPTEPTEPTDPTDPTEPIPLAYALVGYINGADYGCNDDYENVGEYIFVDGTLSTSFNADSYVFIKTTDNANWYMTEAYCAETTGTFVTTGAEKMFVPGGVEITFTLVENEDGTLTLSYVTGAEVPTEPTEPTEPEPIDVVYYVAGSFNGWNAKDENYAMTDNGDGTWSLVIPAMAAGSYEFKITDGTWTNSWGDGSGNFAFKVTADCDVTVTFNAETYEITVTGDGVDTEKEPLVINTIHVAGSAGLAGSEWDPAQNQMTADGSVYTITFTGIAAGKYEFKFVANGAWGLDWASGIEMPSGEVQTAWVKPMGNSFINVAEDDSTVTLTLDLTTMDAYTGEGGTCCAIIEAPAIDDDFTGFKTLADGEYYFVNGVQSTATGLTKIDGIWYYLKSGRWASELNQLAKYNNEWWYLVDGKVASTTTALIDLNGEDWYVVKGKIAGNTTGLVKIDGIWYYLVKGKVAGNTTDLIKYNNEWFYVVKGKVASTTTAMIKYNNEDWYVVKGKIAANTTGLVKYDGVWYYVVKGKLAGNTTTLVKYNNEWFYVVKGRVDSQTTGIVVYNNGWYYLVKGKIAAKTTTLVKYGSSWYYVKEGSVDWSYTGNFVYNGGTYKIVKGRVA